MGFGESTESLDRLAFPLPSAFPEPELLSRGLTEFTKG